MTASTTILVTGATGTIGQALRHATANLNANLLFGTRHPSAANEREIDFSNRDVLLRAMQGVDILFLLLPLVPNKLELAQNAIWAAQQAGVKQIIRSSGMGADAQSPYSLFALNGTIDALVQTSGIPWTLIRPNSFMQNYLTYYGEMIRGGTVYLPQADAAVSLIDVRDIADSIAAILTDASAHQSQIYTLTGNESVTQTTAMATLSRATSRSISYFATDEASSGASLASMGLPPVMIDWMLSLYRAARDGQMAQTTTTVKHLTGKAPRSLSAFATEFAAAWQPSATAELA